MGARLGQACAAAAALGLAGAIAGGFASPRHFLFSYLVAFFFGLTVVLGMLFFVMLHHVTDAGWSTVIRRPAEQFLAAFPVLAVLVIPILLGMKELYAWTSLDPATDHLMHVKQPFLNVPFFIGRAVFYFAVWIGMMWFFRGSSLKQDRTGDPGLSLRMRRLSGPGLMLYAVTLTFAGVDWLMTLEHAWFSTIFGVYIFAGAAVSALAALTLVMMRLVKGPLQGKVAGSQMHDLGKLVFAFAVFWGYIAFSQYFLIWYANIPEETEWMMHRWVGPWPAVTVALAVGMFAIPFVVLMSANAKRHSPTLATVCVILLATHYLDLYWLAMPVIQKDAIAWHYVWIDASCLLLVVGACGLAVQRAMSRAAIHPLRDPRLAEALEAAHGHDDDDDTDPRDTPAGHAPTAG